MIITKVCESYFCLCRTVDVTVIRAAIKIEIINNLANNFNPIYSMHPFALS